MSKEPLQHRRTMPKAKGHKPTKRHVHYDSRRGSSRERGYSTAWDKFSLSFRYQNPLCEYCKAQGRVVPATVTDHDIPHRGDQDLFWANTFTALCKACHDGPKQRAEARLDGDDLLRWVRKRKGCR